MSHTTVHPSPVQHDATCPRGPDRHFRVTRPSVYRMPGCPGHNDPSGRQGHYADACCATQAARIVTERLVKRDRSEGIRHEPFDVQVWR